MKSLRAKAKMVRAVALQRLVTIDEYGSFLTRIASKGQTGNVSEIPGKLQTLWGWSPEAEYIGDIKVGKGGDR